MANLVQSTTFDSPISIVLQIYLNMFASITCNAMWNVRIKHLIVRTCAESNNRRMRVWCKSIGIGFNAMWNFQRMCDPVWRMSMSDVSMSYTLVHYFGASSLSQNGSTVVMRLKFDNSTKKSKTKRKPMLNCQNIGIFSHLFSTNLFIFLKNRRSFIYCVDTNRDDVIY